VPRRRQFADLHGNRNDPTAAARMREKRKAIKLGNELVGRPFTMDEYRDHLAAKGMVPPSAVSYRLDYPDESVTACGLIASEVYLEKKGQEPTCPRCHTPKFILRRLAADKKAKRNDSKKTHRRSQFEGVTVCGLRLEDETNLVGTVYHKGNPNLVFSERGEMPTCKRCLHHPHLFRGCEFVESDVRREQKEMEAERKAASVTPVTNQPEPAVNNRLKFPKKANDRLFRAGIDGRISSAEWRTKFAALETSHGSCKYGKDMFRGARERMETYIKYKEAMWARAGMPLDEEPVTVPQPALDAEPTTYEDAWHDYSAMLDQKYADEASLFDQAKKDGFTSPPPRLWAFPKAGDRFTYEGRTFELTHDIIDSRLDADQIEQSFDRTAKGELFRKCFFKEVTVTQTEEEQ
jgi:hypothetical protein